MHTRPDLDRLARGLAGFGPLLFLAIAMCEGFLRPGYSAIAQPISALARGPRGWVQGVNFALLAIALFSFAVVLRRALRPGASSALAPGVLLLMATGVALAGLFPMDALGAPPTLSGRLHDVGGFLVFPVMPASPFLLSRRFRRDAQWRPYFAYTLATGVFCLLAVAFFLLFVGIPSGPPRVASELRGLVQRLMLLGFFAWIAIVTRAAARLRRDQG